jgi:hypothetical protein
MENNSTILHIPTIKQGLLKKDSNSWAKSSRQSLNAVVIKGHKG